ncbi:unnamed protein product [Brachionus calyciflorus]|uniref:Uncharacterized protein n=1 Tax=Brachionus calyciflorus TaxID=104777 RepID=A0A814G9G8_9BILA|nr:unnamed protein product [Brachionus calyciflorus]
MDTNNFITIGIDFGTSSFCSGGYSGRFSIIENDNSRELLNFLTKKPVEEANFSFGAISEEKIRSNLKDIVFDYKILLAKDYDEIIRENLERMPFHLEKSKQNRVRIILGNNSFEPEQILALFIEKIKDLAEKKFKKTVNSCVITVPCCFNNSERQAVIDSVNIAGIPNVSLINDNTAVATTLAYENKLIKGKNILIFNLGAYYLNLSICDIINGCIYIKASSSFPNMGGRKIDLTMARYLFKNTQNIDFKSENDKKKFFQILIFECEKAKIKLSYSDSTDITIMSILPNDQDFNATLSKKNFDEINEELFSKYLEHVQDLLNRINLKKDDLGEIIMVGGSSRIPKVRDLLSEFFSKNVNLSQNASEAVAFGAIIRAGFLSKQKLTSNNGYCYEEISSNNYFLNITMNDEEKFCLKKHWFENLPVVKNIDFYLKNQNIKFKLQLFEQEKLIWSKNFSGQVERGSFTLNVENNGIVNIDIKLLSNASKIELVNDEKKYCLSNDKKEVLSKWITEIKKQQEKKIQIQTVKNSIESSCYSLKQWLDGTFCQSSSEYYVLSKQLDDSLKSLKEKSNFAEIDEKLKYLEIIRQSVKNEKDTWSSLTCLRLNINVLIFKLENLQNLKDDNFERLERLKNYQKKLVLNEIISDNNELNKIIKDVYNDKEYIEQVILCQVYSLFESFKNDKKISGKNFVKICKKINIENCADKKNLEGKLKSILGSDLFEEIKSTESFSSLWNLI